jgi:hypothetical protein
MTARWIIDEQQVVSQKLTETDTTQNYPLGTVVKGKYVGVESGTDYGAGEFIYLKGVASTVVGSIVNYDSAFQTALDTTALATPRPVAIAMSANVADQYGWYQISGRATAVKSNTVSFAAGAALAAGSGLAIAVVSGLITNGALVAAVASAKSDVTAVDVMINRPHNPSDVS